MTMAVIMVASSLVESTLYPTGPEKTSRNYRIIDKLTLTNEKHSNTYGGKLGFKFIQDNVMRLTSPETISIFTAPVQVSMYQDQAKYEKDFRRTDANYWEILDFSYIEGRGYSQEELDAGRFVAVINQQLKDEFFPNQSALGQTLTANNQSFEIIGVVANVSEIERSASADIWVPYSTMPSSSYQQQVNGAWSALLFHSDPKMYDQMQDEYVSLLKNDVMLPTDGNLTEAYGSATTKLEFIAYQSFGDQYSYDTKVSVLLTIMGILLLLFMLLPSINMINLNVSRIMERSTEIGVRKAFGASKWQLIGQFITESILLTLIGGMIGLAISQLALAFIESHGIIKYAEFALNFRIFIWGLFMIVVFGVLSGAYPAFKMSRLHPVTALKGGA
jgi:putative ABC transport system permease protein